jgi:hypothetical protein
MRLPFVKRRYSSYSFSTSALDGGEWSVSRPGRAFLPQEKEPPVPIVQEAGWASEPVWTQRLEEKSRWPGRPASRQTLYCLSYPGSCLLYQWILIVKETAHISTVWETGLNTAKKVSLPLHIRRRLQRNDCFLHETSSTNISHPWGRRVLQPFTWLRGVTKHKIRVDIFLEISGSHCSE